MWCSVTSDERRRHSSLEERREELVLVVVRVGDDGGGWGESWWVEYCVCVCVKMVANTEDTSKEKNDGSEKPADAVAGGGEKGGSGAANVTAGASLGDGKRDTDVEMTAADGTDGKRDPDATNAMTGAQDQTAAMQGNTSLSCILSRESRELLDNPDTRAFLHSLRARAREHTLIIFIRTPRTSSVLTLVSCGRARGYVCVFSSRFNARFVVCVYICVCFACAMQIR